MPDINLILPLLGGWRYQSFTRITTETLDAGKIKTYLSVSGSPGWLHSAGGTVTNPNAKIIGTIDGIVQLRFTPSDLYATGRTQPNNSSPSLDLYDSINNMYSVGFTPSLWLPFRDSVAVSIENPTSSSISVVEFYGLCIVIYDTVTFTRELKSLLVGL